MAANDSLVLIGGLGSIDAIVPTCVCPFILRGLSPCRVVAVTTVALPDTWNPCMGKNVVFCFKVVLHGGNYCFIERCLFCSICKIIISDTCHCHIIPCKLQCGIIGAVADMMTKGQAVVNCCQLLIEVFVVSSDQNNRILFDKVNDKVLKLFCLISTIHQIAQYY